jgi:hypothetical protein
LPYKAHQYNKDAQLTQYWVEYNKVLEQYEGPADPRILLLWKKPNSTTDILWAPERKPPHADWSNLPSPSSDAFVATGSNLVGRTRLWIYGNSAKMHFSTGSFSWCIQLKLKNNSSQWDNISGTHLQALLTDCYQCPLPSSGGVPCFISILGKTK